MNTLLVRVLLLSVITALQGVAVADSHGATKFKVVKVSDSISILQGKGGNIGVLDGTDGVLMIDDDYPDMSPALNTALVSFGGVSRVNYLINTHWHGDHSGGNALIGEHAKIVAHENVRARLSGRQEVKLFGMVSEPYPEVALPEITYQRGMSLHLNNEHVELVHYAGGHTDGDSVVYFHRANVVHMGDHFFNGFFPFVDVPNGGNVLAMAANVQDVLDRIDDETKVIPGHGPLGSKADLQAFHRMLLGTAEEVAVLKKQGKSLQQVQQHGISAQWSAWAKGFLSEQVWIALVYQSL